MAFYCTLNNVQCSDTILKETFKKNTHSDFDDLTVETVEHNYDVASICRGVGSIVPEK